MSAMTGPSQLIVEAAPERSGGAATAGEFTVRVVLALVFSVSRKGSGFL